MTLNEQDIRHSGLLHSSGLKLHPAENQRAFKESGAPTEIVQYAVHKSLFHSSQGFTIHQDKHIRNNVSHEQHILTV